MPGDFVLYRLFNSITRLSEWLPDFSTDGFHVGAHQHPARIAVFHTHIDLILAGTCIFLPDNPVSAVGIHQPRLYSTERRSVQAALWPAT